MTLRWLASSVQDLRHGVMLLRRDAGSSTLIVLVLALGIGGNAAIFTLFKAAFLDPLPYRDARRLVTIVENNGWMASDSEFLEIRERSRTLDQFAFAEHNDMQLTGSGEPARVFTASVIASFFPALGVNASLGRTFLDEENRPGRAPSVLLTDAFWRMRTGADPRVIEKRCAWTGRRRPSWACCRPDLSSIIQRCTFRSRWIFMSPARYSRWPFNFRAADGVRRCA